MKSWKKLSVTKRLYAVVGIMAVLIAGELFTLRFAMHSLSAVRALVGGESLWSKAQKDAVFSLQRYRITEDEADYQRFLDYLKIPQGDHRARFELLKPQPDFSIVRAGFLQGQIHPDDIDSVIALIQRFHSVKYLERSIAIWAEGDLLLERLTEAAQRFHQLMERKNRDFGAISEIYDRIRAINDQLTPLEAEFSASLGEGSRWLEHVVLLLLFMAVFMVETVGLTLTFATSREISRSLREIRDVAQRVGRGDFSRKASIRSADELGEVGEAVNQMSLRIQESTEGLERRIRERTSDLEKLASENSRLYEKAKDAIQARDEFLSVASHELRTPLTALIMQLQLLERTIRNGDAGRSEELIIRSQHQSKRLTVLIDELMDLTRLRSGKLELQLKECDITAVIAETIADLAATAARKGSLITLHARNPIVGKFDLIRVRQVVMNLISNAIKYGNGNPIDIETVRTGGNILISVRDHGKGIAKEQQARIFERFERATEDTEIGGLGLGLYISRQLVEIHGGEISVESEPGKGSIFRVSLPA